jgi:hypothetical protein
VPTFEPIPFRRRVSSQPTGRRAVTGEPAAGPHPVPKRFNKTHLSPNIANHESSGQAPYQRSAAGAQSRGESSRCTTTSESYGFPCDLTCSFMFDHRGLVRKMSARGPSAASTARRARSSLAGSRCAYTRKVKPGSACPKYSATALADSPASISTKRSTAAGRASRSPGSARRRRCAARASTRAR